MTVDIDGIDLLLLCGARPTLLKRTLESFNARVFRNFKISNVFANIDLFQGGKDQVLENKQLILDYFPNAVVYTPPTPSFTGAVKTLWQSARSQYCLHLEDDWIASDEVTPEMVFPLFRADVAQVSFLVKEKNWRFQAPFHTKWEPRKFFGVRVGKRLLKNEPIFTTGPSFAVGSFLNQCAKLMDESLDPEKQLYDGRNRALREYTRNYKNVLLRGAPFLIEDIGRDFRDAAGLEKRIVDGQTIWTLRQ